MFRLYHPKSIHHNCCNISAHCRFLLQQRFLFPSTRDANTTQKTGSKIYYKGNLTHHVKMLKTFSMSTTISGIICYCIAVSRFGLLEKSSTAAISILSAVCGTLSVSPLLINLVSKRYVVQLAFDDESKVYTVHTLNILNQLKETKFTADQVNSVVNRPFTTFMVGRKPFFVDPLQFSDITVYEHLMGYDKIKHMVDELPSNRNPSKIETKNEDSKKDS